MNTQLKKDLSNLSLLTSLGFTLAKNDRWASYFGALAVGLRLLPSFPSTLKQKSVIITGGSRGLGLALAEDFLKQNSYVTILARDYNELELAQKQLQQISKGRVQAIVCDVTKPQSIRDAFQKVVQKFGTVDILINNAGSITAGPFEAMNLEDFQAQMNLHFFAALMTIQEALPVFKSQKSGHIVNISSVGGKIPIPHMIPYCASKFALSGFSQALTPELTKDNIAVTTVYPGLMRTGSPIQGVFKGDSEKEFAWFAISDSTPGLTVSARSASQQILKAIKAKESELIISIPAKLGTFVYTSFPQLYANSMSAVNRFLPQSYSDQRRTGAQVRGWLDQKFWAQPFLRLMKQAQSKFNEHEKFDPEYNLNISSPISR